MSKRDEIKKLREQRRAEMQKVAAVTPDAEEIVEKPEKIEKEAEINIVETKTNKIESVQNTEDSQKVESKVKLDHTFKIRELDVPTSLTTLRLYKRNSTYTKIRSAQLGMAFQDYINLLIEEDKCRYSDGQTPDPYTMKVPEIESTILKTIVFTEENLAFLKRQSAMCGMKTKEYINYLIDNERAREEKESPRKGYYD